jgi:hypothetical protein
MGNFKKHAFVIAILFCFLVITFTHSLVGAQNQNQSSSNTTIVHKMGLKIIYPLKNTTVPAGHFIIN